MTRKKERELISAEQVANYVVCPEAWRLKFVSGQKSSTPTERPQAGRKIRKDWVEKQELSRTLSGYAKIVYLLIVLVVIVVFLMDIKRTAGGNSNFLRTKTTSPQVKQSQTSVPVLPEEESLLNESWTKVIRESEKSIPPEIAYLLLIVGVLIVLWDFFERHSLKIRRDSGLAKGAEVISAKDSALQPSIVRVSEALGLSSKPDAVIKEDGVLIPVDIEPMGKKIRDRHVVATLVHLRVLEDLEGTRPPYGVLLMGTKKRLVRIKNTDEKQLWLDSLLEEMHSIREGVPAIPTPVFAKCRNCDVGEICEHRAKK